VRLAGARNLKVKARAGGHSWTASSVRDGAFTRSCSATRSGQLHARRAVSDRSCSDSWIGTRQRLT